MNHELHREVFSDDLVEQQGGNEAEEHKGVATFPVGVRAFASWVGGGGGDSARARAMRHVACTAYRHAVNLF